MPQRRLEDPVLRHVVAQLVEGAVGLPVEKQVPLDRGREVELPLEAPDVLMDGEVVAVEPPGDQPGDTLVQHLGKEIDHAAELLRSNIVIVQAPCDAETCPRATPHDST